MGLKISIIGANSDRDVIFQITRKKFTSKSWGYSKIVRISVVGNKHHWSNGEFAKAEVPTSSLNHKGVRCKAAYGYGLDKTEEVNRYCCLLDGDYSDFQKMSYYSHLRWTIWLSRSRALGEERGWFDDLPRGYWDWLGNTMMSTFREPRFSDVRSFFGTIRWQIY